ncbi:unnamed protein product [Fraxinus pennsylvanica]|uniref:Adenylate isopentenyltransferase n=1 Tax=Fraxinus pennsylvanica TaxID=56036 RepID=A0AAD1ZLD0_9LAMI|nr:unnamed protein product [Fraxinus pennsylvanica]
MTTTTTAAAGTRRNKKIVVILGATGSGKSKLSVDLASRFFTHRRSSTLIKSKSTMTLTSRPTKSRYHLLGEFHPSNSHPEFTPSDYRSHGAATISKILSRRNMPIIAGGSNSFIYALLAEKFSPELDVFSESDSINSVFCKQVRYSCCFLWVDVSLPVLNQYLVKRVDDMLDSGMFEELADYFNDPDSDSVSQSGLKKAIGVPEFTKYFNGFKYKAVADVENGLAYEEQSRQSRVNWLKDNWGRAFG